MMQHIFFLKTLQRVLKDLVAEKCPRLHAHLELHEIDLSLFTFNWFLTVFVDGIYPELFLTIWDVFLYEGSKVSRLFINLFIWPVRFVHNFFFICLNDNNFRGSQPCRMYWKLKGDFKFPLIQFSILKYFEVKERIVFVAIPKHYYSRRRYDRFYL